MRRYQKKMEQEIKSTSDPNYRLNIKKNYKGEVGWEFTVRGDSVEEIDKRAGNMKAYIKNNIEKNGKDENNKDNS